MIENTGSKRRNDCRAYAKKMCPYSRGNIPVTNDRRHTLPVVYTLKPSVLRRIPRMRFVERESEKASRAPDDFRKSTKLWGSI